MEIPAPGEDVPNAAELTLREAIRAANSSRNPGVPDGIAFNIPPSDPGHAYYRDDGVAGQVTLDRITRTTA